MNGPSTWTPAICGMEDRQWRTAFMTATIALIGDVGGTDLVVEGILSQSVVALAKAWRSGIPELIKPR